VTTIDGEHNSLWLFDLQRVRVNGPGTLEIFQKTLAGNP